MVPFGQHLLGRLLNRINFGYLCIFHFYFLLLPLMGFFIGWTESRFYSLLESYGPVDVKGLKKIGDPAQKGSPQGTVYNPVIVR